MFNVAATFDPPPLHDLLPNKDVCGSHETENECLCIHSNGCMGRGIYDAAELYMRYDKPVRGFEGIVWRFRKVLGGARHLHMTCFIKVAILG